MIVSISVVNSLFLTCLYICPLKRDKVAESLQAWLWGWVSSAGCSVLGGRAKWEDGGLVFHHNWDWPGFKSAPCSFRAMTLSMQSAKEGSPDHKAAFPCAVSLHAAHQGEGAAWDVCSGLKESSSAPAPWSGMLLLLSLFWSNRGASWFKFSRF